MPVEHYNTHRPNYSTTRKNEGTFPTEPDFDTDNLSAVADHFLLSSSGFDGPEDFDDLELPVVNLQDFPSLNKLWAIRGNSYSVKHNKDTNDEMKAAAEQLIDNISTENFEESREVTVTESEWTKATRDSSANLLGGVVDGVVSLSQPSYFPMGALVRLVFLVSVAVVVEMGR